MKLPLEPKELLAFCDAILANPSIETAMGLFFADGQFLLGIDEANSSPGIKFYVKPFGGGPKKIDFWKTSAARSFCPKHLLRGTLSEQILTSENEAEFLSLLDGPSQQTPSQKYTAATDDHRAEWDSLCRAIDAAIQEKKIVKALAGRFIKLETSEKNQWQNYFSALFARAGKNTHKFFIKQGDEIFFGASPELLLRLEKNKLFVPAIAGTGLYKEDPTPAAAALFASTKDRHEHEIVVRSIVHSLESLELKPEHAKEPEIMTLPGIVHLYTPIHAHTEKLRATTLVQKLHPTPAMGGHPTPEALALLSQEECWNRGYFASPLGYEETDGSGRFIVGIRSALFQPEALYCFAAAGYVQGSKPELEWQETAGKMRSMMGLFTE